MELNNYIKQFGRLHRAKVKGLSAPHKPVLLLSVIDEIENGNISENKIYITPDLVAAFKQNWALLVDSKIFVPNFSLPFFHLDNKGRRIGDKFWHLVINPGSEISLTSSFSIGSFSALKNAVDFAKFDDALFLLLSDKGNRKLFRTFLLDTYFPLTRQKYLRQAGKQNAYIYEIENKILCEPPGEYKKEIEHADEEEIFLRGGVFKKVIPQIYNYTCCISGMRILATANIQMIDACHIVPFSESHDDTITNGISLCPNLHRAFDRGLISIDENYQVIVSKFFVENDSDFLMRKFDNKKIMLPEEKKYHPSPERLGWHLREKFIK